VRIVYCDANLFSAAFVKGSNAAQSLRMNGDANDKEINELQEITK
jgi:hypothetical protein